MRKLSFLSLSAIAILSLSACTKQDDDVQRLTPVYAEDKQNIDEISYSKWTSDASITLAHGGTVSDPIQVFNWSAPKLTQDLIDAGSVVLVYVKSNSAGAVHAMPWNDTDLTSDKVHSYTAFPQAGSIILRHSTSINNVYEVPDNSNDISFRYIIVGPQTPEINGRHITVEQLPSMAYEDVTALLGIPE